MHILKCKNKCIGNISGIQHWGAQYPKLRLSQTFPGLLPFLAVKRPKSRPVLTCHIRCIIYDHPGFIIFATLNIFTSLIYLEHKGTADYSILKELELNRDKFTLFHKRIMCNAKEHGGHSDMWYDILFTLNNHICHGVAYGLASGPTHVASGAILEALYRKPSHMELRHSWKKKKHNHCTLSLSLGYNQVNQIDSFFFHLQ